MIFCIRIKLRMNIHHVLFFCFLSALQDGNTGLVNAINLFAGAEGGRGSIICHFTSSGSTKFFCKGECKEEDILIKTDDVTAQSGRYSIRYEDGSSGRRIVTVYITRLTKSDSGRYRFGLGGSSVPDDYCDFDVTVIDAATLGQNNRFSRAETVGGSVTQGCSNTVNVTRKFFCKDECKKEEDILVETEENRAQNGRYSIEYRERSVFGLYLTITQLKKSDTGRYRCGYGRALSPDSSYTFQIIVVDAPTTSKPNWITSSFPETTEQFTAPTTSKPNWTLRPFPTSVPSASTPTTTQSLISSSGSFTPSSSFPETTEQFTDSYVPQPSYFLPPAIIVPVVVVLLAVVLLLLYKLKTKRRNSDLNTRGTSDSRNMVVNFYNNLSVSNENRPSVSNENCPPVSSCEDNIYQSLDPDSSDPDQNYSALTANK